MSNFAIVLILSLLARTFAFNSPVHTYSPSAASVEVKPAQSEHWEESLWADDGHGGIETVQGDGDHGADRGDGGGGDGHVYRLQRLRNSV